MDALLVAACQGDADATGELLGRYEPLLRSHVARHLGPRRFQAEGEDLLQSVRLEVLRFLPALRNRTQAAFTVWLGKLVRCRLLDWEKVRRSHRRTPESPPLRLLTTWMSQIAGRTPTPSQIVVTKEQRARIEESVKSVPPQYQEVLRLILAKEPSREELATFLGKNAEAARKFVMRALEHLRRVLRAKEETGTV